MSILDITNDITLNLDATLYFINPSTNIVITLTDIVNDMEFYNLIRTDNSTNIVNINLGTCLLCTGENNFNVEPMSNITLMSKNNIWYPISGYTQMR